VNTTIKYTIWVLQGDFVNLPWTLEDFKSVMYSPRSPLESAKDDDYLMAIL